MCRRTSFIVLLVTTALLASCQPSPPSFVCTDAIGCVEIAPHEPIKIGVMQNLSGEGPPGMFMVHCVELAVVDRGRAILGHQVELVTADSRCSTAGGTTAALRITADPQIVGIVGPSCSSEAAAAADIVSPAGLVMISGSSTAPSLTSVGGEQSPDWRPGFLRTAQNDALAGRAAAIFAFRELGKEKAATTNAGDPYTRGLTNTFRRTFVELGGQLALDAAVNQGDRDMRPVLNAVAASGAEILFLPVYQPEGNYLVLQAAEIESFQEIVLMSADGLFFETFVAAVGDAGVGMYLMSPTPASSPEYLAFLSRYKARYQEPPEPIYDATTYDAANLLMATIEVVAIQDADGTLHIGRQALRDALYATSGFQGLTGTLACDRYGDCGVAHFNIMRLDDPAAGLEGLMANVIWTYPPAE